MKRLTVLLLALLLTLTLCSCNTKEETSDNDEPKVTNTDNQTDIKAEDTNEETENNADETDEAIEFTRGTVTNNTYESKYAGLGIELDDTWTFSSDEEINTLMGIAGDLSGDEQRKALIEALAITDMVAINPNAYSVVVTFEKNLPSVLKTISMDTVMDNTIASTKSTYENLGVTDTQIEKTTVNIQGEEFNAIRMKVNYMGVDKIGRAHV